MKNVLAFVLAAISAYTLSFSIDLFAGGLFKVYSTAAFLPAVTWVVISMITGFPALLLAPRGRFLCVPFVLITLIALLGGIVGHRHSLIVAAVMLVQSALIWLGTNRQPVGQERVH